MVRGNLEFLEGLLHTGKLGLKALVKIAACLVFTTDKAATNACDIQYLSYQHEVILCATLASGGPWSTRRF